MSVLGIDVGTSTCKGIVIDAEGKVLAKKQCVYLEKPKLENNKAYISAQVFVDSAFSIIRELALSVKKEDAIEAIAFSTHGETLILVDKSGNAVSPAILSMDRRCLLETQLLEKEIGKEAFYSICGTPIHTQYPVPKLMWFKNNDELTFAKAEKYCTVQDYLHGKLGVGYFVDYSLASRFGGFDVKKRSWSGEILSVSSIKSSKFSTPVPSGTVIGIIPSAIAKSLCLEDNVLVVAGGHDQPCAGLVMGAEKGKMTVSAGSYECASIVTDKPLNDLNGLKYGLNSYCHVINDKYITLAFFASGLIINWFVEKLCPFLESGDKKIYSILEDMAPKTNTGICFTPHLYGSMNPRWDDTAKATITGLTGEMNLGHLYKAVMEGTACELNLNLSVLEDLSDKIEKVILCGGGTKSDTWMQVRADILNKPLYRIEGDIDASCIGATILAGIGIKTFVDYKQAIDKIKYRLTEFLPINASMYSEQKERYSKTI